jgi:hypothetical protein
MLGYFECILSNFKWYRKKKGGTWYKIYDGSSDFGLAGDTYSWVQKPLGNVTILKQEQYTVVRRIKDT